MSDSINNAENRILILYALAQAGYSMTKHDLSLIMLENLLMSYYNFSDSIYGLKDGRFISNDKSGQDEFISITESGKKMLDLFLLSQDKHKLLMIDNYMKDLKDELLVKSTVLTNITPMDVNRYKVELKLKEGKSNIFELALEVPSEDEAIDIASRWKSDPQTVYSEILKIFSK